MLQWLITVRVHLVRMEPAALPGLWRTRVTAIVQRRAHVSRNIDAN